MTWVGKKSQIFLDYHDYSEGFKPLDNQHRDIVLMINEIAEILFSEDIDFRLLFDKLNTFEKLVIYHFGFEQEMMDEMQFDKVKREKHSAHHKVALVTVNKIKEFSENQEDANSNAAVKLGSALIGWFSEHERNHDHQMVEEFKKYLDGRVRAPK